MTIYHKGLAQHLPKLTAMLAGVIVIATLATACEEAPTADEFLTSAQELREKGDIQGSIIQAKNALRLNGNDQDARFILGSNYLDLGDWRSAETTLTSALSKGGTLEYAIIPLLARAKLSIGKFDEVLVLASIRPDMSNALKSEILVVRGEAFVGLRKFDQARARFDEALTVNPKAFKAYLGLISLENLRGEHSKVDEFLAKASEIEADAAEVLFYRGVVAFFKRDIKTSRESFQKLTEKYPLRIDYPIWLAWAQIASGDAKAGIESLARPMSAFPNSLMTNYLRAVGAYVTKDYVTAAEFTDKVLQINQRHMPSLLISGASRFALKEYESAAKVLSRYVARDPANVTARKLLGATQLKIGQASQSAETLRSLDSEDLNSELLKLIGVASIRSGDLGAASRYFARIISLNPEDSQAQAALGHTRIALGDLDQGIKDLKKAVDSDPSLIRAEMSIIIIQVRQKRYSDALEQIEGALGRHPDNATLYSLKGLVHVALKQQDEAVNAFETALKLKPTQRDAAFNLALLAYRKSNYVKALGYVNTILENSPNHLRTMAFLVELHGKMGNAAKSLQVHEKLISTHPGYISGRLSLGMRYLASKSYLKALQVADDGLLRSPNQNVGLMEIRGRAEMALGRHKAAVDTFEALIEREPDRTESLVLLANAYQSAKNWPGVADTAKKILTKHPDHKAAKFHQAKSFAHLNRLGDAKVLLDELKKDDPDSAAIAELEGRIALLERRGQDAVKLLAKALSARETNYLLVQVATAEMSIGKIDDAEQRIVGWLKRYPEDFYTRAFLSDIFLATNRIDRAVEQLELIVGKDRKNSTALNNLAWAWGSQGKLAKALEYAQRAFEISPNDPSILDTYGDLLVKNENVRDGLRVLTQAIELDPKNPSVRFHYIRALVANNKIGMAEEMLSKLLGQKTPFAERRDAELLMGKLSKQ